MKTQKFSWASLVPSCLLATAITAQGPPQPEDINTTTTSFLDHETPISGSWGQTQLKENIPFIEIPDSLLQDVYYYRWASIARHLRYTTAGSGYILTEFCQPVGYASAFNTIDAAAGHQIDESRWFRSKFYDDDYISVYTRGPGDTTQYTHWIHDAAYRRTHVTGDSSFLNQQLEDMVRIYDLWNYTYDSSFGLYYFTPDFDAQEYSLPGYVVDPNGAHDPGDLQFVGPNTFRPSHNSYMMANVRAIAHTAGLLGDVSTASKYHQMANKLEDNIYKHLWNPNVSFFVDFITPQYNPNLTQLSGREEVGFYPYRFGIGLTTKYANASTAIMYSDAFLTEYGPTTLETGNEYYTPTKPDGYCCYWQGQSWPFSTAHTLKSLAAIYRSGQTSLTADQFVQYMRVYALTQQKNGVPYVAEAHYPSMDSWSADSYNHSEHYDHSTNNDDVITSLLGIIPQSDNTLVVSPIIPRNWTYFAIENLGYHGHLITVLYDQTGSRYHQGKGITVFVDGTHTYNGAGASAKISLPTTPKESPAIPVNIAANPNGVGAYPSAEATYTWVYDAPFKANDGYIFYDSEPDNRWTNYDSPNANDTLTITFPRPRNMSSVTIALYSDVARGGAVDVPSQIQIHGSSGLLANPASSTFVANDKNTFMFPETTTNFISVNMFNPRQGVFIGLCELEVWVPASTGPLHYAVDAVLTSANVMFDTSSKATTNGAVVGNLGSSSLVAFSGITAQGNGQRQTLTLSYSNSGSSSSSVQVVVNQVPQGTLSLPSTGGAYKTVSTSINLEGGKNYVSIKGGSSGVNLETLTIS